MQLNKIINKGYLIETKSDLYFWA